VERLSVVGKTSTIKRANIAAPGDGRTPNATSLRTSRPALRASRAFTLIEVLVVVVLMSFIILALMAVFNGTQTAFRASLTQTDVLQGGRAAMGMITSDLEAMTPSDSGGVNFYYAVTNYSTPPSPLFQSLVGSGKGQLRTNLLENFFILSRGNLNGLDSWIGTGYAVTTNSPDGLASLYSLYRYTTNHPASGYDPQGLFYTDFTNFFMAPTNGSHLMDGVVELTVRAYDTNGLWMTTNVVVNHGAATTVYAYPYYPFAWGEPSAFYMMSNALPASVEINLGVLEDRTMQRAESLPNVTPVWAQSNYLAGRAGQVHVFRQRVWIRNVDPSAYQ
jgi:prepilin-type N-terminal cleavage/methylation domain-containing protein